MREKKKRKRGVKGRFINMKRKIRGEWGWRKEDKMEIREEEEEN